MKQQCALIAALLVVSTMAGPCETDHDCSGSFFCNCNYVCDKCDENGLNCAAEEVSGRPSGCTDNPGMDQGHDTPEPTPSPTGMFDGSDPDTPRDPGCCMAQDWSVHDATKCINAYKVQYCDNEPGWENCQWIHDTDHVDQADCEQPEEDACALCDEEEFMPYCCDGQKYDNECYGYCAGAMECLGMKHPDNTCKDEVCSKMCMDGFECVFDEDMEMSCQKVDDGDDDEDEDDEGCCMGDTERKMNMCSKSPSQTNCDNMNGCHWSADCAVPTSPPGCCYASDLNNRMADRCYDVDYDTCANGARMGCAWMEGENADCSAPTPEPGCCYGSDNACDTDDQAMCEKNARRKGCEWRSGKDADCAPVPGCCSGMNEGCFDIDEAMCAKNARRMGCEWITGTTDCEMPTPEPGCCYASDPHNKQASKCYGIDATACAKGARMSCAWMSGDHADCSIEEPEPEEGCCASETERKTASCNNSPSAMNCANMNGCFWVDGADADCSWQEEDDHDAMCCGDESSKMNMCSNSMSQMNCDNMNGCHWVGMASECSMEDEMFLFAGEGVTEAMNSQVSLSTLLLCLVCAFALWKVYGWWSNGGDAKVKQFASADGQGYYQSV